MRARSQSSILPSLGGSPQDHRRRQRSHTLRPADVKKGAVASSSSSSSDSDAENGASNVIPLNRIATPGRNAAGAAAAAASIMLSPQRVLNMSQQQQQDAAAINNVSGDAQHQQPQMANDDQHEPYYEIVVPPDQPHFRAIRTTLTGEQAAAAKLSSNSGFLMDGVVKKTRLGHSFCANGVVFRHHVVSAEGDGAFVQLLRAGLEHYRGDDDTLANYLSRCFSFPAHITTAQDAVAQFRKVAPPAASTHGSSSNANNSSNHHLLANCVVVSVRAGIPRRGEETMRCVVTTCNITDGEPFIVDAQSIFRAFDDERWCDPQSLAAFPKPVIFSSGVVSGDPVFQRLIGELPVPLHRDRPVKSLDLWPRATYNHGVGSNVREGNETEQQQKAIKPAVSYPARMVELRPCEALNGELEVVAGPLGVPYGTAFCYGGILSTPKRNKALAAFSKAQQQAEQMQPKELDVENFVYSYEVGGSRVILGNSVARYINHKLNFSPSGNVQFVNLLVMPSDENNNNNSSKTTAQQRGAKNKKQQEHADIERNKPGRDTIIPFFFVTRDVAPGEALLADSYGPSYDAEMERFVACGGAPLSAVDAALLLARKQKEHREHNHDDGRATEKRPSTSLGYDACYRHSVDRGSLLAVPNITAGEIDVFLVHATCWGDTRPPRNCVPPDFVDTESAVAQMLACEDEGMMMFDGSIEQDGGQLLLLAADDNNAGGNANNSSSSSSDAPQNIHVARLRRYFARAVQATVADENQRDSSMSAADGVRACRRVPRFVLAEKLQRRTKFGAKEELELGKLVEAGSVESANDVFVFIRQTSPGKLSLKGATATATTTTAAASSSNSNVAPSLVLLDACCCVPVLPQRDGVWPVSISADESRPGEGALELVVITTDVAKQMLESCAASLPAVAACDDAALFQILRRMEPKI